ncbi:FadR/GntR family transcriptional regulator [Paenibacillus xerothermodurans]|uniref:FadR family transcriptional regulator n=1 Tax=Paenibacillus xerothermodurans TaxID=1977292 RepID=A0A2W1NDU1_PAEXE|nr:GntR family transcriptional regulator [Paenibacillus xerothermodurans]PZE22134.1 FadR family transcriptional regulator [Paenibacillus xerothermodurans]
MKKTYTLTAVARTFEQVARQIAQYIEAQHLAPGTKLPAERALSEILQVSRSSVREGIRVLEILGFLEAKHGEGTFVALPPLCLLPHRMIGLGPSPAEWRDYYDFSLLLARQVILLSAARGNAYDQSSGSDNFWQCMLVFVYDLAERLDATRHTGLWYECFDMVVQYGPLLQQEPPFAFQELIDAHNASDRPRLNELLNRLACNIYHL